MININDIEKIMEAVDKFDFSRFEFQQEDSKIVIDRNTVQKTVSNESSKIETRVPEDEIEKTIKEDTAKTEEINVNKEYIKASFAGTFYSAKEQGGPTFVKLYDEVQYDTVVGLIEVMKLFNELEAGVQGTIVDVLVKDGDFVEYGQPLFEIKSK
ncbi:MAG: acetyl-CoA carboxylase biotin carboxyl carrier protein subunit [Clostridiaceae bacterium]